MSSGLHGNFPPIQAILSCVRRWLKGDAETAFRAAHTLKGLCLNLGFESLYKVDAALTEELRAGKLEEAKTSLPGVREKNMRSLSDLSQSCKRERGRNERGETFSKVSPLPKL